MSNEVDEYTNAWARNFFALPFLWLAVGVTGVPSINPAFWKIVIGMVPLEIIIVVLYFRAIKQSPLSLTIPFTSLTPFFAAVGGFLLLHESLSPRLWLAVCLFAVGGYVIKSDAVSRVHFLQSFLSLIKEKEPLLMSVPCFILLQ